MLNYDTDTIISGFTRNFNHHKNTLILIQTNYQFQFQTEDFNTKMGNLFHLKSENGVDAAKGQTKAILEDLQTYQTQIDGLLCRIQAYSDRLTETQSALDINGLKHKTIQNCLRDVQKLLEFAQDQKNIFDQVERSLHEVLAEKTDPSMVTAKDLLLSFMGRKFDINAPEHTAILSEVCDLINDDQQDQAYDKIQEYAQSQQASLNQFSYGF